MIVHWLQLMWNQVPFAIAGVEQAWLEVLLVLVSHNFADPDDLLVVKIVDPASDDWAYLRVGFVHDGLLRIEGLNRLELFSNAHRRWVEFDIGNLEAEVVA